MGKKISAWWIGILSLLAGLGGGIQLSEDDFDNVYICPLTNDVRLFQKISENEQIGFYMEDEEEKSLECRKGNIYDSWVPLKTYIQMTNMSALDLIKMSGRPSGKKWECDFDNCYALN